MFVRLSLSPEVSFCGRDEDRHKVLYFEFCMIHFPFVCRSSHFISRIMSFRGTTTIFRGMLRPPMLARGASLFLADTSQPRIANSVLLAEHSCRSVRRTEFAINRDRPSLVARRFFSGCDDCTGCGPLLPADAAASAPAGVAAVPPRRNLTLLTHEHDGQKIDNSILQAMRESGVPIFSMFGPLRDAQIKRFCYMSTVNMVSGSAEKKTADTLAGCTVEEIVIKCGDCGIERRVETPRDFLDPNRNTTKKALLAICPSCVLQIR